MILFRATRPEPLAPARSESVPAGAMLLSAEQLREACNLWGDASFDTELARLQTVAVQHIEGVFGLSVMSATRRDYYRGPARRLRLALPASSASAEWLAALGGTWTAVSDQALDASESPPHVVLTEARRDALEASRSDDVSMPLRVVYMTGADSGAVSEAAREAVRKLVAHEFYTRTGQPSTERSMLYAEVKRLLGPYMRDDGVTARALHAA